MRGGSPPMPCSKQENLITAATIFIVAARAVSDADQDYLVRGD
jgi:hypothetical protein